MSKALQGKYHTRSDYNGSKRRCGKQKSYYWCRYYCDDRDVCIWIRKKEL